MEEEEEGGFIAAKEEELGVEKTILLQTGIVEHNFTYLRFIFAGTGATPRPS
jgi:hypothetical protein